MWNAVISFICDRTKIVFMALTCAFLSISFLQHVTVQAVVHNMDSVAKFDQTVESTELVLVNFHAEWCRFSQMLNPVFEAASNLFLTDPNVKFASVDCDHQTEIAQRYHINKYPVLRLFRFGKAAKREYKGARSAEALRDYIQSQQKDVVKVWSTDDEMAHKIDPSKRSIMAHVKSKESMEYHAYRHIAAGLSEYCEFHAVFSPIADFGSVSPNTLAFQSAKADIPRDLYPGDPFRNYNDTDQWVTDRCIPLVREITFENAEDLTEEGLPFLILFRQKDDEHSLEEFTKAIKENLADQREGINALHADGEKFAHPLHHLGKSTKDLPLVAIDSFKHMYLFPDFKYLRKKNRLKRFVEDMHSGKLHREFHYGPDPGSKPDEEEDEKEEETQPSTPPASGSAEHPKPPGDHEAQPDVQPPSADSSEHKRNREPKPPAQTPPVQSVFQKLKPQRTRYTILKDEL